MPRKKKNNLDRFRQSQKEASNADAFKTPAIPAERSGSSVISSTLSHNSSLVATDTKVLTRSQARRANVATTVALPGYQPIDVEAWTQQSLTASQEEQPVDLPGKLTIKYFYHYSTPSLAAAAPVYSSLGSTVSVVGSLLGESRKRGRPRKNTPTNSDVSDGRLSYTSESSACSKRGRPRKKAFKGGRPTKDSATGGN
jgi:hypothetical protein